ncbi:ABC-type glycerol-3-phosphate transport system substrate-binding protein [Microbacterium sp. W4I20]|nr:ABC-type glycerol-3-phosphate transport system substrate-binding protein [Microbacterium sp. W4I20]
MTRHTTRAVLGTGAVLLASTLVLAGCGSGFSGDDAAEPETEGLTSSDDALSVLIGSSGDAETAAVQAAVDAWSEESGTEVSLQVASDLGQELSQGFAAGEPADLFYLSTDQIAGFASNGSLQAYGDQLSNKDDFYPSLVENFTIDDTFYCAPKDFSTLALVINTQMWTDAGLTDADLPKTWDDLAAVAKTLTTADHVGLAFGAEYQRIGTFMAQAGGGLVSDGAAIADNDANVEALDYVKSHLEDGTFAFAKDVGVGWGRRGPGQGRRRHGDRRQLDHRRHVERLQLGGLHRRGAPRGPWWPGHAAVHELLGHGGRQPQPAGGTRARRVPHQRRQPAGVLEGLRADAVDRVGR